MKRQWKLSFLAMAVLSVVALFVLKPAIANASNPATINFQGKVVNANGTNVADGTYSFVFKLYTVTSGGTAIWTETDSLSVAGGVFQVNLGASCPFFTANACNNSAPIDFNANPNIYLGITFNGDPAGEMTPRVQLQSVPYAYNSDKVGGLSASQLVQLSPGTQQTGFVNVGGSTASTFGAGLSVTGNSTFNQTSSQAITLVSGSNAPSYLQSSLGTLALGDNSDFNGTTNVYGITGASSLILQSAGTVAIYTAPSGTAGATESLTEQFTILNGGNVGIGTSSPSSLLSVGNASQFQINSSGAIVASTGIANSGAYVQSGTSANTFSGDSSFTGSGTGLSVTNSATIGTGLTITTGGATITGNSSVTGNLAVTGTETITEGPTDSLTLTNSTNSSYFQTPAGQLDIGNNSVYNGSNNVYDVTGASSLFQQAGGVIALYTAPSGTAGATETLTARFTILNGGNIGVGTTTPTSLLSVGSSSQFQVNTAGAIVASTGIDNSGAYTQTGTSANTFTGASTFSATGTGLTITNTGVIGTLSVGATATIGTGLTVSAGGASIAGATTINGGAINLNASSNFAVNIGTGTSTGAITIGSNLNTFSLASTGVDISTAGAISSVTTLTGATLDATTAFQANGTAGIAVSCAKGDYLNTEVVTEGILTSNGGCATIGLSDERLKTDIIPIDNTNVLNELGQVNPVNFDYDCSNPWFVENNVSCDTEPQTGVLAQQLMQVFPNLVNADQPDGYYSVNYQGLSVYTLEGVDQLAQYINASGDANFNSTTTNSLSINGDANIAGALTVDGNENIEGNLDFNNISVNSGTFSDNIITPSLVSSGALTINSGSDSDVSIDSPGGSVNVGTSTASVVNIGNYGSTTTINGKLITNGSTDQIGSLSLDFGGSTNSLNIDDAGSTGAISAAINVADSSGNGYNNIISSSNFNVGGNGNIETNGSIVSRGGSFVMYGSSGNQVVYFDSSGDASFGGSLNMASASISGGLTVGGDINVGGLSTFQQLATFIAKAVFKQDVEFEGHITVNSDTAGYAALRVGESTVHVSFTNAYQNPPVVTASIENGQFGLVSVNNVTDQGFDLSLSQAAAAPTTLSWTAVDVSNPQTATNPQPNQSGQTSSGASSGGSLTTTP